ncbi:S41 family peptidase [Mucilaginibacter pedocola]|uniref:Tail specific protease domain-containing protein n=1 Tax=Mucilaginibacter pedocola TaxID=1792845 RepID=A0A1S9PIN8_9SPHI|nr:S41 family peptidase [Mucilaginibacter pedocola]OOQ60814.1 hypothetical protein BC343_22850 [Mucilaginibacter pedocola]
MKKITAIIAVLLLGAAVLKAQSKQQIENLTAYTKVWGFLKYYHPSAAKGQPDWDAEYIKNVPAINKIAERGAFDKFITEWYNSLPKAKLSGEVTRLQGDSVIKVFDEKDIARFGIPKVLQKSLEELYLYHLPDSSKYINDFDGRYKYDHVFHNEDPMAAPLYPDEAHRLLALARFWNIVNYFYPHKKTNAPGWDEVLVEFIPKFKEARNADEYREAFLQLTTRIHDSHSWFLQKEWNAAHGDFLNMPFDTYYAEGKFLIGYSKYDSLMRAADLKVGDEIVAINGLPVLERVKQIAPHTTGTNASSYYREIGRNLFRIDSNKTVRITLDRNGQRLEKQLKLYTYGELFQYRVKHRPKIATDMGHGVWYVRFCEIGDVRTLKKMYTDIANAKTVILEMRDYPSFQIVQAMWPGLVAKRLPAEVNYNAILGFPGTFKANISEIPATPDTLGLPLYKGKLVVLVNEQTQSLAESVAAELRMRPNTIIIGRQTAGTTGNMVRVDIPGGIEGSYTAVKVLGINGSFEEGNGVKLDKEVKLSLKNIRSVPDYLLEKAYQESL